MPPPSMTKSVLPLVESPTTPVQRVHFNPKLVLPALVALDCLATLSIYHFIDNTPLSYIWASCCFLFKLLCYGQIASFHWYFKLPQLGDEAYYSLQFMRALFMYIALFASYAYVNDTSGPETPSDLATLVWSFAILCDLLAFWLATNCGWWTWRPGREENPETAPLLDNTAK